MTIKRTMATATPFVGPLPIPAGELLFGRQREIRELVDQLIPERLVLLYSPSGAGKTSLIQAGLVPAFREKGFFDLPILKVGHEIPADLGLEDDALSRPPNRYVLSLLLSIEEAFGQPLPLCELCALTLDAYLTRRQDDLGVNSSLLLLFDQFEEVLTFDPSDLESKDEFFRQVGEALAHPRRWALFSMREDHVASLDPYLRRLPTRLRTRYRLELLAAEGARKAIQEPARLAGREITNEAASALVDDLRQQRVQGARGEIGDRLGVFIEPVQLQVVCARLWKRCTPSSPTIDIHDLAAVGSVDSALKAYYSEVLQDACDGDESQERGLRRWLESQLISPQGLRAQVLLNVAREDLDQETIDTLVDNHLIRLERRRGIFWLEISHDRLVDPIRAENEAWRRTHQSPLQRHVELWLQGGRSESFLLRGKALHKISTWAKLHPSEKLTGPELNFLRHSEELARSRGRRIISGVFASLVLFGLIVSQQYFRVHSSLQESRSRETTTQAMMKAKDDPGLAALLSLTGIQLHESLESRFSVIDILEQTPRLTVDLRSFQEKILALSYSPLDADPLLLSGGQTSVSDWQLSHSTSGKLSTQEGSAPSQIIAVNPSGTLIAQVLRDTGQLEIRELKSWTLRYKIAIPDEVAARCLSFSPDSRQLVVGGSSNPGSWQESSPELLLLRLDEEVVIERWQPPGHSEVSSVDFSHTNQVLASGSSNGTIHLWDTTSLELAAELRGGHAGPVTALAFHPESRWLVSGSEDWTVLNWDLSSKAFFSSLFEHSAGVTALDFDAAGRVLLSGSRDRTARLWDFDRKREIALLEGHRHQIVEVAFSPDGLQVATGGADGQILIWRVDDPHPSLGGSRSEESTLAFDPEGKLLTVLDRRGFFEKWRLSDRDQVDQIRVSSSPSTRHFLLHPQNDLGPWRVSISPTGSPNGQEVLVYRADKTLRGRFIHDKSEEVTAVAMSDSRGALFTATSEGGLHRWDLTRGQATNSHQRAHHSQICALRVSPSGTLVVSADVAGGLTLWRSKNLEKLHSVHPPASSASLCQLAFAPTERILATADRAGSLAFWDLGNGNLKLEVKIDNVLSESIDREISSLAFDRHGELLAVGGYRDILLWDVEKKRQVGPILQAHQNRVTNLAFSSVSSLLASSSADRIVLWNFETDVWRQRACRLANRNLTRTEWRQYVDEDVPYEPVCPEYPVPKG